MKFRLPWGYNCEKGRHNWREETSTFKGPAGHVFTQVHLKCLRCGKRHYQGTTAGAPPEAANGYPPPSAWRGKRRVPREPVFRPRNKGN